MQKPYFSIVIPAHNEEQYVPALLASLKRQDLDEAFEIIVVDNASQDQTGIVAADLGATVITETRLGLPQARETGRLAAKGEVLVFLDADMLVPIHYLRKLKKFFVSRPEIIATTNPFTFYDGNLVQNLIISFYSKVLFRGQNLLLHIIKVPCQLLGGNFAIRSTALREIGGFDLDTMFEGDDMGISKKLAPHGKIVVLTTLYTKTSARRFSDQGMVRTCYFYVKEYFTNLVD